MREETSTDLTTSTAKHLNIPIYITTQNAARLGNTVSEITSMLPDPENIPTDAKSMNNTKPATCK